MNELSFRKYMHVERFGNEEVQGIELGECYVFPKIDGTNSSLWWSGEISAGSRNRKLSIDSDNAGFYGWSIGCFALMFEAFFKEYPQLRLYGEWLVSHSLKTYRDSAWRKFYVFDVFDEVEERFLVYEKYLALIEPFNIDYIPPLCLFKNATYENFLTELKKNHFLIQEGKGIGEGVVIKNYNFKNKFGRVVWAKIISNEFKEKHVREMGAPVKIMKELVEGSICDKFITVSLVEKVYAKIVNEKEGWDSRYIPRLLATVFYDLVKEETWNFVKEMKNPTVDFKALNRLVVLKIKTIKPELF